jgi:cleavage and polyadenylation specificity factor subunit 1
LAYSSFVTDASTSALGAVLQQRVENAFFSKKLSLAQQKYISYDRELLAVYEGVKHFRHTLEARHFTIFMYHKLITNAFQQKRNAHCGNSITSISSPSLPLT